MSIKNKVAMVAVGMAFCLGLTGCESCSRQMKSFNSDFGGGLHRKVTVYDYSGNEIKSWEGTFDVSEDDQECWFDLDGKRVIIQGGIIIDEEL